MTTLETHIFEPFGLAAQVPALTQAMKVTNAYIGGGVALARYMFDPIRPEQDLDIFYTPFDAAPESITHLLFHTIFTAAGYEPRPESTGGYKKAKVLHIKRIYNWSHPTLNRTIQLVVRSPYAEKPAYVCADFDICQFFLAYDGETGGLHLFYDTETSALTQETVKEIGRHRVMRIGNLKGQSLGNVLRRLRKYYDRGFAFEKVLEHSCTCRCGLQAHTVKTTRRMSLAQAALFVCNKFNEANPPPRHLFAGDSWDEEETIPAPAAAVEIIPPLPATESKPEIIPPLPAAPAERPPPLEIPPVLEITDAFSTPPRPKRNLPPRLCRKDDSWIRPSKD